MKPCPVIVTEGEEATHHHRLHSERGTKSKREAREGSEGKAKADGAEASRIKAILETTMKLTSLLKASSTIETRPKTTSLAG
jgi:hypothetical protein